MKSNRFRYLGALCASFALALALAPASSAQEANNSSRQTNPAAVASGQKMKLNGVVTRRDSDTFTVRDLNGGETVVRLSDRTSVKTKGGFLRSGTNYGQTQILRGLSVEVEGRGDGSGQLVAEKVRFNESDLRVARSIESRVDPVETRVGTAEGRIEQAETNSQRLSGQMDELAAVSNAARGGAKAAQDTADAAVAGVNATNERISSLDDYQEQNNTTIQFKLRSAVLSRDAKAQLDQLAQQALQARGYVLEVSGFASREGGPEANRRLSQRRADAVIRYLVETHNIPLRRIITPYGYGEMQPVADNTTRAGRAENRRVEVKVLVNRGLTQGTQVSTGATSSATN
ncbi:MAG TPA: OmpA family protein [Pyrinomonadaceae bacterium]|nr:OmpA family protein [Pyrinomonadaceae bacterium]